MFSGNKKAGFTLIEMVVVLAIFGIITAILVPNIPQLRDKTSVDLVAQSVALHIRGAQVYGIGTRVDSGVSGGVNFRSGIHFAADRPNSSFLLFASNTSDPYTGTAGNCEISDGCIESYSLRKVEIVDICYYDDSDDDSGSSTCQPIGDSEAVDVTYLRPSSEASFCIHSGGSCQSNVSRISVTLQSSVRVEEEKVITIWKNGQISVENEVQ